MSVRKHIFTFLLLGALGSGVAVGQEGYMDSLKRALGSAQHDTSICRLLSLIIESEHDLKLVEVYNERLMNTSLKGLEGSTLSQGEYKTLRSLYAAALCNQGYLEQEGGNVARALELYEKARQIQEELGDNSGMAVTLNNFGGIFYNQGDIPKALEYYHQSLKLREAAGYQEGIAQSLNNLGVIHQDQEEYDKALEYYNRSLKIREQMKDDYGIALSLGNMGATYLYRKEPAKALEFFARSLDLQRKIDDKEGISYSLNNIGAVYDRHGDPACKEQAEICRSRGLDSALAYYRQSLKIREELGDKQGVAYSYVSIGGAYFKLADLSQSQKEKNLNLRQALQHALKSLQLGRELGYPDIVRTAAERLSRIYKARGMDQEALDHFELFIRMRDSLTNESNKRASLRSQLKYEYEKRATADSVKTAEERKVVEAQLRQEQTQRWALCGGLILVGLFSVFMVNRFRVTSRQKKLIEEQKAVVEAQKQLVEEKQKEILDSIHYARRIQSALITNENYIVRNLKRLREP